MLRTEQTGWAVLYFCLFQGESGCGRPPPEAWPGDDGETGCWNPDDSRRLVSPWIQDLTDQELDALLAAYRQNVGDARVHIEGDE
jgi:hypothetical protein